MVWRGEATARSAVADAVPLLFLVHEFVCRVGARSASDGPIVATSTQAGGALSLRLVARSEKACEAVAGGPLFDSLLAELGGSVAVEAPVPPDGTLTASLHLARSEPARPAARAPHAAATTIQT